MARDGSKSGGRPKGRKNNSTLEAEALAKKLGVDPFEILLLFAKGDWQALGYQEERRVVGINEFGQWDEYTIPVSVRARAAEKASEFMRPKLKSIDLTGDGLADAMAQSFTALMAGIENAKDGDPTQS